MLLVSDRTCELEISWIEVERGKYSYFFIRTLIFRFVNLDLGDLCFGLGDEGLSAVLDPSLVFLSIIDRFLITVYASTPVGFLYIVQSTLRHLGYPVPISFLR